MTKRFLTVVFVLVSLTCSWAQRTYFSNYNALEVKGALPADFLETFSERYSHTAKRVDATQSRHDRKLEDRFFELNGLSSEMIRLSGRLLLDDTVTNYLNRIADRLLVDAPKLRSRISIYSMKSAVPNAFATPDGMIMINLGLLTRCQSEDELAFVLAHEIAHIYKDHSRNNYLQKYRFESGTYTSKEYEKTWELHSYSQFSEMQADSLGYELYVRAGYKPFAAIRTLYMLGFADYPYSNDKIDLQEWNDGRFVIQPEFAESKFCEPEFNEGGGSEATHPSLNTRLTQIADFIPEGSDTLLSADSTFAFIVEVALFESARLYNQDGDWVSAFYHISRLLKKYPDNVYLERELARTLHIAAVCRNRTSLDYYNVSCGEALRFYELVHKQTAAQCNSMLLKMTWSLHLKHPEDKDILWYAFGIMSELVSQNKIALDFFEYREEIFLKEIGMSGETDDLKIDSAYAKWREKAFKSGKSSLYRFAFAKEVKDRDFRNYFSQAEKLLNDTVGVIEQVTSSLVGEAPKEGGQICLTPFTYYRNISRRSTESVNYKRMSKMRNDYVQSLTASSNSLDMKLLIANPAVTKDNSAGNYNFVSVLSEWTDCKDIFHDSTILVMPFPVTAMKKIEDVGKGSTVVNCGYIQVQAGREIQPYHILLGVMGITFPNLIWTLTKPHYAAAYFFQSYNIRTGRLEYDEFVRTDDMVYRRSIVSTHVYHSLRIIKKGK